MKKTYLTLGLFPLFTLSVSLLSSAVFSQEDQVSELERITVSGTKTERPLSDVIGSISHLSGEELVEVGHVHINESLFRAPGTWISRGNGQEHLTAIRSPVLTGAGGCGAFFIAQDGISARGPGFCNINQLFDLNSEQAGAIEVVRGPASTLYGSNAVHGVINVLSQDLFAADTQSISLEAGPHSYFRGKAGLRSLGDSQRIGLFANIANDGGYKDDSGFDQQKFDLIHQLKNDKYSLKTVLSAANLNQETAGFIEGEQAFRDPLLRRTNPNPEAFRDSKALRLYSQYRQWLSDSSDIKITPYFRYTDMRFIQHFVPWQPIENNGQRSAGIQAQYNKQYEMLAISSGLDVDYTQGYLTEVQFIDFSPTIPIGPHYDYEVDNLTLSPYVNADWLASDKLTFTFGLRYDYSEYDYTNNLTDGSACAANVSNCRFSRPTSQSLDFNNVSSQLGINYQWLENHGLYLKLSQGFRAPQATELFRLQQGQEIADLDSERLNGVELGFRGQSNNLFYDIALFNQEKSHFIFQDTQRQNVSNGETDHQGIEVNLRYNFSTKFYAEFSGTVAKHTYANDIQISASSIENNDIDTAPREFSNLRFSWQPIETLTTELEWIHLGDYFLNPENTARYAGHNLINLRTHWQVSNDLTFSARITNLTNTNYAERADFAFGDFRYFVGESRGIYWQVSYQY